MVLQLTGCPAEVAASLEGSLLLPLYTLQAAGCLTLPTSSLAFWHRDLALRCALPVFGSRSKLWDAVSPILYSWDLVSLLLYSDRCPNKGLEARGL